MWLWGLVLPILIVRLAFASRGWSLASAIVLVFAMPVPGMFFYGFGPYDAFPWYEGIAGIFMAAAGLCLLVSAVRSRAPASESSAEVAVRATT